MLGPDKATRTKGASRPIGRPEGARRKPLLTALPFCVVLILAAVGLNLAHAQASGDSCTPGVGEVTRSDDSFRWTSLLSGTAAWDGSVALREDVDGSCYVHHIYIDFGPERSGTLTLTGSPYVSFTVQYPSAFTHSSDVALNAIGDLDEHNPQAGSYLTYTVAENRDINAAGADEYVVRGIGLAAIVTDVVVGIELPLDFLGKTVYAQIHVGPDHCQCSVTAFTIPGAPPPPPPSPEAWDVYVHAHQDDWQLWESPDSYNHYQAGDHLLFVYTTAGDAGQDISRWGAREQGAEASVRYIVGAGAPEGSGSVNFCYTAGQQVCHSIWTWTYGDTVSVFMRVPDGGNHGGGFPSTGGQTMEKLRDGNITSMSAVDGSTTYQSWADFYSTINAIIAAYTPYDSTTRVNAPDIDRNRQTGHFNGCDPCEDHADHLGTGDAVWNATYGMGTPWTRVLYIDYMIAWADSRYPVNLDNASYAIKKALFMSYVNTTKALTGEDEYSEMPYFWENAFHREYSRTA